MSQSHHGKVQGRDNSCTSGEAASARNYKFPTSHERHFPIPHEWLSRRGEITIPHERRSREWGNCYFTTTAKPWVGNREVPWVTSGEFARPGTFPWWDLHSYTARENFNKLYWNQFRKFINIKKHHVINSIQLPQWNLQRIKPIPSP